MCACYGLLLCSPRAKNSFYILKFFFFFFFFFKKKIKKKGRGGDEREGGEKRNCVMELQCSLEKLMPDRMKITITEN